MRNVRDGNLSTSIPVVKVASKAGLALNSIHILAAFLAVPPRSAAHSSTFQPTHTRWQLRSTFSSLFFSPMRAWFFTKCVLFVIASTRERPLESDDELFGGVRYGGPNVQQMDEVPDAEIRDPHDIIVQVHAVALNPVSWRCGYDHSMAYLTTSLCLVA